MSEQPIYLFKKGELPAGQVRKQVVGACELAVYNVDGTFYATQDGCTHATASLAEGEIVDGDLIACPVHDGTFHIPSGQPMGWPCEVALRTYKVTAQGDDVLVDLSQEADEAAGGI
jgi:ethylbenzene dioxygenase ferredoxin subunit